MYTHTYTYIHIYIYIYIYTHTHTWNWNEFVYINCLVNVQYIWGSYYLKAIIAIIFHFTKEWMCHFLITSLRGSNVILWNSWSTISRSVTQRLVFSLLDYCGKISVCFMVCYFPRNEDVQRNADATNTTEANITSGQVLFFIRRMLFACLWLVLFGQRRQVEKAQSTHGHRAILSPQTRCLVWM